MSKQLESDSKQRIEAIPVGRMTLYFLPKFKRYRLESTGKGVLFLPILFD